MTVGVAAVMSGLGVACVTETRIGIHGNAPNRWRFTDTPSDSVRLSVVAAGCRGDVVFGSDLGSIPGLLGKERT